MKEKFEALVEHLVGHGFFLEEVVELLERTLIERTLERTGGNRSAASKLLGIHRNTLQRKMAEYKLDQPKARRKPVRGESSARGKAATA
ncbi:MAG TPA: helix-turn-helix domain-containing protein [Bryobacteraceae bacterium]|jgi:DNA-binding NtrC family response regulator|nr:helix-turn-helix domain-containing protein [Bryobacteraceae bacterium]